MHPSPQVGLGQWLVHSFGPGNRQRYPTQVLHVPVEGWIDMKRHMIHSAMVAFILLPSCIFVHELGHFSVAKSYGWEPQMFPARVSFHLDHDPGKLPRVLFLVAGPIIDICQVATGVLILILLRRRDSEGRGILYWSGVVLAFVSVKWVLTPLIAFFVPANDEIQISEIVGWPPMLLPVLVMLLGVPVVVFVFKQHLRQGTVIPLLFVPLFGFLGAGVWTQLLGPQILN